MLNRQKVTKILLKINNFKMLKKELNFTYAIPKITAIDANIN